jgi:hypothetical protein
MILNHIYFSFSQQLPEFSEQLPLCYNKSGGSELSME